MFTNAYLVSVLRLRYSVLTFIIKRNKEKLEVYILNCDYYYFFISIIFIIVVIDIVALFFIILLLLYIHCYVFVIVKNYNGKWKSQNRLYYIPLHSPIWLLKN